MQMLKDVIARALTHCQHRHLCAGPPEPLVWEAHKDGEIDGRCKLLQIRL